MLALWIRWAHGTVRLHIEMHQASLYVNTQHCEALHTTAGKSCSGVGTHLLTAKSVAIVR